MPGDHNPKFQRCVDDVKAEGSADNPWAVCHASTGEAKPNETIQETIMRQIIEAKLKSGCKCQKRKI